MNQHQEENEENKKIIDQFAQQLSLSESEEKNRKEQPSSKPEENKSKESYPKPNGSSIREYWNSHRHNNHRERLAWMTGNNKILMETFKKCQTWAELHRWHQENTPWLEENRINLLMKSYHEEAKEKADKVNVNQRWMLDFNL